MSDYLRMKNKREKDESLIDLLFRCFECMEVNDIEPFVNQAIEFCNKEQNISTQRIGGYMITFLAPKMEKT